MLGEFSLACNAGVIARIVLNSMTRDSGGML